MVREDERDRGELCNLLDFFIDWLDGIGARKGAHEIVRSVLELSPNLVDQVLYEFALVQVIRTARCIGELRDDEPIAEFLVLANLYS